MNDRFVCIKVDREERPDVDAVLMEACQAMTGQGGWPLNAFLTPEQEPFFVGTYYPPESRHGLPSWRAVLDAIAEAWSERRDEVRKQGSQVLRVARRRLAVAGLRRADHRRAAERGGRRPARRLRRAQRRLRTARRSSRRRR